MDSLSLVDTLRLEPLEVNLFRATTPAAATGRIFGGQVIAQALLAAYATVEERICHSLHCYFIRSGDSAAPIILEVDRARDGGSFTTRRVVAIQHGQSIFNLAASFQDQETGFEHQAPMPAAPGWAALPDEQALRKPSPEASAASPARPGAIEIRAEDAGGLTADGPREPQRRIWLRACDPIGDDLRLHQVILAYASDMGLMGTAMRPHGVHWRTPGFQAASLDHAMWFHRPLNLNAWHLYDMDAPSASGGRGFNRGAIYAEDGTLVASVAQEGLIRLRT